MVSRSGTCEKCGRKNVCRLLVDAEDFPVGEPYTTSLSAGVRYVCGDCSR